MAIFTKLMRIIGLPAMAGALTACSAVKMGYSALPELAFWRLDAYLDFDDTQAAQVRERLATLHQWHRSHELPRYAALLEQAERLAPADITPAQACGLLDQVRERMAAIARHAEPAMAATAASLTAAQLQHLQKHYARTDAEWRRDWLDAPAGAVQQRRLKQLTERAEMIYGTLDDTQRAVLQRTVEQAAFDARAVLAERQRRQQDALDTLRAITATPGLPAAQARAALRGYLQRTLESPDAAWRARRDAWQQEMCRGFAALHAGTTAAQREAAVRRLRAYQRDLQELAAAP